MSLRNIPFGYKFENGKPVLHPEESEIVKEIFTLYCAGDSLKAIAENLTQRKIEYIPSKTGWNKARIKRILENIKYADDGGYPAIISKEQFVAANLKKDVANKSNPIADADIKLFKEYTICTDCGNTLQRRADSRFDEPVSWKCHECGWSVKLGDDTLKAAVIGLMNVLIENPSLVEIEQPTQTISTLESKRLRNEFNRAMDSQAPEEELLEMALRIMAEKYTALADGPAITARLAADFSQAQPHSACQKELFLRTVWHVRLGRDGKITLELQNGKIFEGSASH